MRVFALLCLLAFTAVISAEQVVPAEAASPCTSGGTC